MSKRQRIPLECGTILKQKTIEVTFNRILLLVNRRMNNAGTPMWDVVWLPEMADSYLREEYLSDPLWWEKLA